ncbi:hypothetical protein ACMYYO_02705 [Dermacoccaceae bacterium W4C1]
MSELWKYIAALLPSAGLLYLFYVVLKHMLEADRRERAAQAKWDAEHPLEQAEEKPSKSPTHGIPD